MKAWTQSHYGGPETLALTTVPDLDAASLRRGQVLVAVTAVPVEAASLHLMTGEPYAARVVSGLRTPHRRPTPGVAAAGVVVAVGPDVTTVAPGDRVVGSAAGALAERVVMRADRLARITRGVSDAAAALLPVSGGTALQALQAAKLSHDPSVSPSPAPRVAVIGAGGSVGSIVTALAARGGAQVTAIASAGKAQLVRRLGVQRHLDYRVVPDPTDWGMHEVVIETADGRPLSVLRRALTPRGTLVVVGADVGGGALLGPASRQLHALLQNPFTRQRLVPVAQSERAADTELLLGLLAEGLDLPVAGEYPFADAPAAYREFRERKPAGTLIVRVAPSPA